ncbi:GNAT family N-acetyltransferase [Bacteroidia bacterium]|nr:GNAT family N-acetyltransferase [Bacteroidia bacterium]MDC1395034.1 GNAT family N-acetyltransferase [Bacteroidia bacterium]
MSKVTIRKAKQTDVPVMLELIKELAVFENAPLEVANTEERMIEDGFGVDKIYDAFVAEIDNKIVGTAITYYRYSTWKGKCLYLEDLIISEAYRGLGAGQQLFNYCIDFGKENNCKKMIWQVLDWNQPAIDFYKKYGAHLVGEWINGSLDL